MRQLCIAMGRCGVGGRCSANLLLPGPLTGAGRLQGQRDALCMASPSKANNCPLLCLLREAGTGLDAGGLAPQLPLGQMFWFAATFASTLTPWPAGVGPMGRGIMSWPLGTSFQQGNKRKLLKAPERNRSRYHPCCTPEPTGSLPSGGQGHALSEPTQLGT